jgi:hypothetical protein
LEGIKNLKKTPKGPHETEEKYDKKIHQSDGKMTEDKEEMRTMTADFYKELYTSERVQVWINCSICSSQGHSREEFQVNLTI